MILIDILTNSFKNQVRHKIINRILPLMYMMKSEAYPSLQGHHNSTDLRIDKLTTTKKLVCNTPTHKGYPLSQVIPKIHRHDILVGTLFLLISTSVNLSFGAEGDQEHFMLSSTQENLINLFTFALNIVSNLFARILIKLRSRSYLDLSENRVNTLMMSITFENFKTIQHKKVSCTR